MRKFSTILIISLITLLPGGCGFFKKSPTEIAQNVTVSIDSCASGSGVLYRRRGNTYYVLTAKHNLEGTDINLCLLITPDGVRYSIQPEQVFVIEKVDLAVVEFSTNKSYQTVELGNSDEATIGQIVYIGGFPAPNQTVGREWRVTEGKITGRPPEAQLGYTLIYDNTTLKGMSGGPVLDERGRLVGIHGRGESEYGSKESYGIPINKFPYSLLLTLEKLWKLLQARQWKEADLETETVMLQVAGREEEGWLSAEDIKQFPCEELRAIDQLWVKHSNGLFGFSIQKRIYQDLGGTKEYNKQIWEAWADRVGWRKNGKLLSYWEQPVNAFAPPGQLPVVGGLVGGAGVGGIFFERLKTCDL